MTLREVIEKKLVSVPPSEKTANTRAAQKLRETLRSKAYNPARDPELRRFVQSLKRDNHV